MGWMKRIGESIASAWNLFASMADAVLRYYVRKSDPKYAVAAFIMANIVVASFAYFLTSSWNDFYTVSGYWVTLTGFLVAIGELYRTRSMTDQLRVARFQERRRQQSRHLRHCLQRAKTDLAETHAHAAGYHWSLAVFRLNDLTENLSHVDGVNPSADNRWKDLAQAAQGWAVAFAAGQNGKKLPYSLTEWFSFRQTVSGHLDSELSPFQFDVESDDDVEQ